MVIDSKSEQVVKDPQNFDENLTTELWIHEVIAVTPCDEVCERTPFTGHWGDNVEVLIVFQEIGAFEHVPIITELASSGDFLVGILFASGLEIGIDNTLGELLDGDTLGMVRVRCLVDVFADTWTNDSIIETPAPRVAMSQWLERLEGVYSVGLSRIIRADEINRTSLIDRQALGRNNLQVFGCSRAMDFWMERFLWRREDCSLRHEIGIAQTRTVMVRHRCG